MDEEEEMTNVQRPPLVDHQGGIDEEMLVAGSGEAAEVLPQCEGGELEGGEPAQVGAEEVTVPGMEDSRLGFVNSGSMEEVEHHGGDEDEIVMTAGGAGGEEEVAASAVQPEAGVAIAHHETDDSRMGSFQSASLKEEGGRDVVDAAPQVEHLDGDGEDKFVGGDDVGEAVENLPQCEAGEVKEKRGEGGGTTEVEVLVTDAAIVQVIDDSQRVFSDTAPVEEVVMADVHEAQQSNREEEVMAVAGEIMERSSSHEANRHEEDVKVEGVEPSEVEVEAVEAEAVMRHGIDESQLGLAHSASGEEQMTDVHKAQPSENPVGDVEEMLMVDSELVEASLPQSNVVEGAAPAEAEAEFSEAEASTAQEMDNSQLVDSPMVPPAGEEETEAAYAPPADAGDEDIMTEALMSMEEKELSASADVSSRGGGRRKRGRPPRVQASKPPPKKGEEDVCFICFDGGNLVVCDRRGCPKVYHPSCVNRDEAFFRAKGRWNCGWHICSICERAAHFMCYTCTYSLCKGCMKEAEFVCVRGNKGFCETCRSTVMLIETSEQANSTMVNFDDKTSWEYLFKDYWLDLKGKLSITLDEITKAKKPAKRSLVRSEDSSDERYEANNGATSSSDSSSGHRGGSKSARKKVKRRARGGNNEDSSISIMDSVGSSLSGDSEWASKELLEFVSHMRDGDVSVLSQFDVQALLLEYIKRNNLRDPRRKSQIICDSRLESLFGKARVGHFEMLKLLESHFLIKEASQVVTDDDQGAIGDPDSGHLDAEGSSDAAMKTSSDKKRKNRRKEERERQTNLDDYAAVDVHNITLVYLRRNLMEELLDDVENFNQKVVGSFVRIRISGTGQKQDMYRIVQVVGTTKAAEKYKTGKRTTDIALEILNLNKTEVIPIDSISNQEFTEEECKRLRQSIKCGFIRPMTVGDLQEKALALQAVRVNDWLESEKLRLGHLRDRASEKGRRKELRECVEKLQLLSTPEERSRRLNEIPEVHADPNMDPSYESAEEELDDKKTENYGRPRESGLIRKGRDPSSAGKGSVSNDSWSAARNVSITASESSRGVPRDIFTYAGDRTHEPTRSQGKDMLQPNSLETPTNMASPSSLQTGVWNNSQAAAGPGQSPRLASGSTLTSLPTGISTASSISESDKIWHYQDPKGKVQGPFSMIQLRKWNSSNYFPRDLRIWKTTEKQDDSILLTDALIGKFQKELPALESHHNITRPQKAIVTMTPYQTPSNQGQGGSGVNVVQQQGAIWNSSGQTVFQPNISGPSGQQSSGELWKSQLATEFSNRLGNDTYNLPTPTPKPISGGWVGHALENKSAAVRTIGSSSDANPRQVVNGVNQSSPAAFGPNTTASKPAETGRSWGEPAVLGQQSSSATSNRGIIDTNNYQSSFCPSPIPKTEQSRIFAPEEQQKSVAPNSDRNGLSPLADSMVSAPVKNFSLPSCDRPEVDTIQERTKVAGFESQESTPASFEKPDLDNSGNNPAHVGDGITHRQFQKPEAVLPVRQPASSGDWASSVPTKNSDWSMPSPTPSIDSSGLNSVAKGAAVNPLALSDSSRPAAVSAQWQTNTLLEAVQQLTSDQTIAREQQHSGRRFAPEDASTGTETAQKNTNMGRGSATQGNPNISWGTMAQGSSNVGWANPAQGNANANVGWGSAAQINPAANTVWRPPGQGNPNTGWGNPMQGNLNPNAGWGAAAPANTNLNTNWGAPIQGTPNPNPAWGVTTPENTGPNGSWGAPVQGNANPSAGWGMPAQGNPTANPAWGVGNGNMNMGWNVPAGNSGGWGTQQRENKDKYSGHGDGGFQSNESGHGSGRNRTHSTSGGSSRPPQGGWGVCKYHESGHCKKGSSCNYLHT